MVPEHYLSEFRDVFSKTEFDRFLERRKWDHAIELVPGCKEFTSKIYLLSLEEQKHLDEFLEENLRSGRIQPSKSPFASPFFFVRKKDGKLQPVQDYRKLNAITVKNCYPLPLISKVIHKLQQAKYFTKLDVRWGYNNVRIKEGDEHKAAFVTNRGLFEPLVMFFGLTHSPATFQTMMNDIFQDLISQDKIIVYMDDIMIFSRTLEAHRHIVREVLRTLRKHDLYLKPERCEFERSEVEYLGLIVGVGKVAMDPVKVQGITEWPELETKNDLQQFLGFINFYQRFIRNFADIAKPLHALTGKALWQWGLLEKLAFEALKRVVATQPVLAFSTDDNQYKVKADSSNFASGAVLSQFQNGVWVPIAYMSKSSMTLSGTMKFMIRRC
jgi:hypothetical protein